jgi:NADP-dependent 3-hydroxy acid dehydrogenase YdfG
MFTPPSDHPHTRQDRRLLDRYCPIALVTRASSGIGRTIDAAFDLVLVAHRADALAELAGELRGRSGARVQVLPGDLGRTEKVALVLDMGDVYGHAANVFGQRLVDRV